MDSLSTRFLESARLRRDKVALAGPNGERFTYAELEDEVLRHTRTLEADEIGSRDRVAVIADDAATFVTAFLACRQLGATVIPLATSQTPRELHEVFAVTRPTAVFARSLHLAALQDGPLLERRAVLPLDEPDRWARRPSRWLSVDSRDDPSAEGSSGDRGLSDDVALPDSTPASDRDLEPAPRPDRVAIAVSYVGTGRPRRAPLYETDVLANLDAVQRINEGLADERRPLLTILAPHLLPNLLVGFVLPLCVGATVHHLEPRPLPSAIRACIRDEAIDTVVSTPPVFCSLLREPVSAREDFAEVRAGLSLGGYFPEVLLAKIRERLGLAICQTYGTSATLLLASNHLDDNRLGTLGRALAGIDLQVHDDHGQPAPIGAIGDIAASGPSVCDRTPIPDAIDNENDNVVYTGDRGRIDEDGFLHLIAHDKKTARVDGETVDLEEVRRVLEAHPQVDRAIVEARSDETSGQRIDAFVTTRLDERTLAEYCDETLSPHKIPRRITLRRTTPGMHDAPLHATSTRT